MSRFFYADNSLLSDRIELRASSSWAHQPLASTLVDEQTKQAASIEVLWIALSHFIDYQSNSNYRLVS